MGWDGNGFRFRFYLFFLLFGFFGDEYLFLYLEDSSYVVFGGRKVIMVLLVLELFFREDLCLAGRFWDFGGEGVWGEGIFGVMIFF